MSCIFCLARSWKRLVGKLFEFQLIYATRSFASFSLFINSVLLHSLYYMSDLKMGLRYSKSIPDHWSYPAVDCNWNNANSVFIIKCKPSFTGFQRGRITSAHPAGTSVTKIWNFRIQAYIALWFISRNEVRSKFSLPASLEQLEKHDTIRIKYRSRSV